MIELFLGMQGQMEELSRQTQALNDRMQLMMEQMVLSRRTVWQIQRKMADSEQIRFMEVDGTIVFFNEQRQSATWMHRNLMTWIESTKKKNSREKSRGLTVKRIDHYLKEEELTAEFGENGWKQLPDASSTVLSVHSGQCRDRGTSYRRLFQ